MLLTMYDSIDVMSLPAGADLYAGYDDGAWPDAAAIAARFPSKTVVRITVFPNDNEGDVLDVETGDATPADAPAWVQRRRAAGHTWPTVYCSTSLWSSVQAAFGAQNVAPPFYWVAAYPGGGPTVPPGAIAHQYADAGNYDVSVVLPGWPPTSPNPSPPGEDVPAPSDVVASWSVPGSNGATYFDLHADGGLFAYGGAVPTELEYVASANDGSRYHFGPGTWPVISYPGLPAADRAGTRYFLSMTVLAYEGNAVSGVGPEGPPGPQGPAGPAGPAGNAANFAPIVTQIKAAGAALSAV